MESFRKRRWLVLKRDGLYYYKNENEATPKGVIPLSEVKEVQRLPDEGEARAHLFCAVTKKRKLVNNNNHFNA